LPIVTDPLPADREVCSGNVGGDEADDEPDECHGDQQPRERPRRPVVASRKLRYGVGAIRSIPQPRINWALGRDLPELGWGSRA
jgi:hypothetical protein